MTTCNCMGPQNGEPLCPCQMRTVQGWYGAENWGPRNTGRSATQQSTRKLLAEAPDATIERYERGLREIGELLNGDPPRVGDASFVVEALLEK